MAVIGSNSVAAQVYSSVQRSDGNVGAVSKTRAQSNRAGVEFRMPPSATPNGDWVLSENASPQNFESGSPRGTYLNLVV